MKNKKVLALLLSATMAAAPCSSVMAAYTDAQLEAFGNGGYTDNEIANNKVSQTIAEQSAVLLKNNGALPIATSDKLKNVALFGNGATGTVKGGTGSGIVNQRERDWIDTAVEAAGYNITTPKAYREAVGRGVVATGFSGSKMANDVELTDEWVEEAKQDTDTAIYVLARNCGEGRDRKPEKGDYYLTDIERQNIEKIAKKFEKVIVVLNTQVVDVSWIDDIDNIDSVLYIGFGGQRAGAACVNLLNGTVNPSGKLNLTWAKDIYDYASSDAGFGSLDGNTATEYYSDGIYVGYRYFDTFGKDVAYEFGYGLSYTDFDINVEDVSIDADQVGVDVTVTNTGDVTGKEVVQVYFSAPDGEMEKAYQELAAYGKTDELKPGEKQTLHLTYDTADMSAYSEDKAAYVMEKGEYIVRVGDSSRNTHVAAVGVLDEDVVTEQLSNQLEMEDGAELDELSKEGATPITYDGEAEEIKNAERIAIDEVTYQGDNASKYDDETVTTYLFVDDAKDYTANDEVILQTKKVAGVLENNTGKGGYKTTTYSEKVQEVADLPEGMTKDTVTLTDVLEGTISMEQFVASLSVEEMAKLVNGSSTKSVGYIYDEDGNIVSYTHAMLGNVGRSTTELFASRHVPALANCDGPAGIRCDQDGVISPRIDEDNRVGGTYFYSKDGVTIADQDEEGAEKYNVLPTAFPSAINVACTWDTDLMYAYGEGVGKEQKEYGATIWLAPGMNIVKNPMGARTFEYYSEDPYLTGIATANVVSGAQSNHGVGVTVKHFWANSQEDNRNAENNVISERTAREIYLKGFEIGVELGKPMCLMTCYNENNGWPGGDSYDTCTDIARGEWGFTGYIMTDWGGGQASPHISMHAGNDMISPGKASSVITNYLEVRKPEFTEDGYVKVTETSRPWGGVIRTENWGTFVPSKGGKVTYEVPVESYSVLSEDTLDAISRGEAKFTRSSEGNFVTWYGFNNCIVLGDLQKSAANILNVMLYTQDMQQLCEDLDIDYANTKYAKAYSEAQNAPMTDGWTQMTKDPVQKTETSETVKASLDRLIQLVESLDSEEYTEESWKSVEEALAAAKEVQANENASQKEMSDAVNSLMNAFGNLEYAVQKLHLEVAVEAAEEILANAKDYNGNAKALKAAAEAGKQVLENKDATQEEVNEAANAILSELAALEEKTDVSSLKNLIEAAKKLLDGNYTESSLEALKEAITNAEDVLANPDKTDAEMSNAYTQIIDAVMNLQMKGNKAALQAMIKKAQEILADKAAYVAATIDGLEEILAKAETVNNNDNAVQEEVNAAVKELTLKVAQARLIGDVDGDGNVTTSDSAFLLQYAAETIELSAEAQASADVNGDGVADTNDAAEILQYAAEQIASF